MFLSCILNGAKFVCISVFPMYFRCSVCQNDQRWSYLNTALQRNVDVHVTSRPSSGEAGMSYRIAGAESGTGIPVNALPHGIQLLRNCQRAFDWVLSKQVR